MPIRRKLLPLILGSMTLFMTYSPTLAMRAPASRESTTATGLEEILQAGLEEISIFLEATIREGGLVGKPEPYQPSRKIDPSDPDIWRDMNIRQAEWVVLKGVPTEEGRGKENQGKAVIRLKSLSEKPIITTADYAKAFNREVMVKVRPDRDGGPPQILAVYNSAKEIIEGIRVYVDTGDLKIIGGGPKKDEPYAFLTDDVGPDLWKDPRINNETVQRVFLRGIPSYNSRGWSAFRISEDIEVVTNGRYSTISNRTVMAEMQRNPTAPKEWIVAKVFNGARENISPTFSKSDINVYLDTAPLGGLVPSGSRTRMTTSLLGPTFWGNMEVMSSQQVLLEGVPVMDVNGVAGAKVGQRQIMLTDIPYNPETRLLIYAHPAAQQSLPFVESAFDDSRKVYPPRKILISVDPVISGGRIESAASQFWLDADKVDAGQFWNLTEIKDAQRGAWSGAPIEESLGYASVKVAGNTYTSQVPFQSLEGDQLLVVARPESREITAAYRLLNADRVSFRKASGLEEFTDMFGAMIADARSELSQMPITDQAVTIAGTQRALVVQPDGLHKLSGAPFFLIPGQKPFRIEALATSAEHQQQVRENLRSLGFTNYRVYNVQEFGGVEQAVKSLWAKLLDEQIKPMLVTATTGLEEVGRFLGRPVGESPARALEVTADRYRSLWL